MKQLSQNLLKIRNDKTGEYEIMPAVGGDKASSILYKNTNNVLDGENVQDVLDDVSSKIGRTLTKAEYDALSQYEKENGTYFIKDVNVMLGASGVEYDNKHSKLDAETVQEAIDKVAETVESVVEEAGKSEINDNGVSTDKTWSSSKIQKTIESIVVSGGGEGTGSALTTAYDNSTSGLNAGSVQGAIDELDTNVDELEAYVNGLTAEKISALPIIDAQSSDYDMDAILSGSTHNALYITNKDTLGTPYQKGISDYAAALILSHANGPNFGIQIAYMTGSIPLIRTKKNGVIEDWTTGFLPLTGGVVTGDFTVSKSTNAAVYVENTGNKRVAYLQASNNNNMAITNIKEDFTDKTELIITDESADLVDSILYNRKVNGESKIYRVYGEHNKPSASDVGALPSKTTPNVDYNTLLETGYFEVQGNCPNNPYGSSSTDTHFHVLCFHHAYAGWNKQVAFDVRSDNMFIRTQTNGTWSSWTTLFVPLSGGTMSGKLTIDGNRDWEHLDMVDSKDVMYRLRGGSDGTSQAQFHISVSEDNTNDNRTYINIRRNLASTHEIFSDALILTNVINGTYTAYKVYGEHNVNCGSTNIYASGGSLTTGCYYDIYE